jgi:putative ATP-binding cassette transporter
METFTPSLDWGDELITSVLWVAKAWVIGAAGMLVALALLGRFTTWGRQFWRADDYFTGRQSIPVWLWLGVLLLSVMIDVRLSVLFSYQSNDEFSAFQAAFEGEGAVKDAAIDGFWIAILIYVGLAITDIVRTLLDLYLMQRFIIRWRVWLTHRLTGDWLDGDAYYRGRFIDRPIDNPDQRIQQDIDIFTTGTGPETNTPTVGTAQTLVFGTVTSIVFGGVIHPDSVESGRPAHGLRCHRAEGAVLDGTRVRVLHERGQLMTRFAAIIANYRAFVRRGVAFQGWNRSVSQIVNPLPSVIQAPRVFAGEIQLGDVTQSSRAFLQVHDSLAFFRAVYDSFASYRAAIIRLDGLIAANETSRELPILTALPSSDGSVELDNVEVRTPDGVRLVDPLDVRLGAGDSMVITGGSGTGKTTLLRSLAQLWPFTSGTLRRPADDTLFLSQMPYVPLGDLRSVISYPAVAGEFDNAAIQAALDTVTLGHLASRLDEVADWGKVLSPGEQQRIAFARVLLAKPKAVFLDESTSALDEGQEFALYRSLRTALPACVVVSVSHRGTVEQQHDRRLELLGGGQWRLARIDAPA